MDSLIVSAGSSAGFPIRIIPNNVMFTTSQNFVLPDTFTGDKIYVSGCGAGGGGSGLYDGNEKVGGTGGQGGASAFRLPVAAKAGDTINITVGAGGIASSTYGLDSPTYSRTRHFGQDGGNTIIRNETALAENRNAPLTALLYEIQLWGGKGGAHSVPQVQYYGAYWPSAVRSKLQEWGVSARWADIGFWVEGGQGGSGYRRQVSASSGGTPTAYNISYASSGDLVFNQSYAFSAKNGGGYEAGGGGGTLYSPYNYGGGGKGSNNRVSNATDGQDGFVLIEWD